MQTTDLSINIAQTMTPGVHTLCHISVDLSPLPSNDWHSFLPLLMPQTVPCFESSSQLLHHISKGLTLIQTEFANQDSMVLL